MMYTGTGDFYLSYMRHPSGTYMETFHFHESYELYAILEGRKCFHVNGEILDFEAPALLLLKPAILHRAFSPDDRPQRRLVLNFTSEMMERWEDVADQTILTDTNSALLYRPTQEFCERLAEQISELDIRENRMNRIRLNGRIFDAVCALSQMEPVYTIDYIRDAAKEKHVVDILMYIKNHLRENLQKEDLAAQFGYTPDNFTRLLKNYTGMTYRDHLQALRLEMAVNMLAYSENTMEVIAESCGYSSANYFGDSMMRQLSMPPTQFRRLAKQVTQDNQIAFRREELIRKVKEMK